jgi:hypothetical protein
MMYRIGYCAEGLLEEGSFCSCFVALLVCSHSLVNLARIFVVEGIVQFFLVLG